MSRFSARQRLVISGLFVTLVVGLLDRLAGHNAPEPAQAAPTSAPVTSAPSADWSSVNALIARLTGSQYTPLGPQLDAPRRDLFRPSPALAALAAPAPAPGEQSAAASQPAAATQPAFAARHKLSGVILARQPLAVIDGRLLAPGDVLDGLPLREVRRDRVVFAPDTDGAAVELLLPTRTGELRQPTSEPAPAAETAAPPEPDNP